MPLQRPAEPLITVPEPRTQHGLHLNVAPSNWSKPELQRAAEDGEFVLHYQPVISLVDGGVSGVEALLRWQHPTLGVLTADSFIRAVADAGLLQHLLPEILDAACDTAAALAHGTTRAPFVAVNVDPDQLVDDAVVSIVESALDSSGARAESLVIEMTERTETLDHAATLAVVSELNDLGVQFAIDDFGTGHSSLARIKRIPATKVKIDRSFVRDVVDDFDDQAIVASVALLADGLGLECVAEGIECSDQATTVAELGCTSGQGFLWSEAVAAADIADTIQTAGAAETADAPGPALKRARNACTGAQPRQASRR